MKVPIVLLVNPPALLEKPDCGQAGGLFLPENLKITAMNPGILSIATYLDSRSIPVEICDLSLSENFENLRESIRNIKPDVIGVSSTSAFDYLETLECLKIAEEERPEAIRVGGGQHIGMLGESAFHDSSHLQVLAKYEGEKVMEQIVDCVKNRRSLLGLKGIVVRDGEDLHDDHRLSPYVDLDDIPPLRYELYPDYKKFTPFVEESRGCPYGCEYCTSRSINNKRIRYKNPEHFAVELDHAIALWGRKPIYAILAASFGMRIKQTIELAKIFHSADIKWTTEFRADCRWEDYLDELYISGFTVANVGLESASPEILLRMLKTRHPRQYLAKMVSMINRISRMPNLALRVNFMFYVGETPQTVRETIVFLVQNIGGIDSILYTPVFITPGSLLQKNFTIYEKEFGARLIVSPYWAKRHLYLCQPSKYFSFEEAVYVCNALEKVFSTPEGWLASEIYHYSQIEEGLEQKLVDGRYSAV